MFKINNIKINQDHFPDNSLLLKLPDFNTNNINILWNYESDSELFTLICIAKHYQNNNDNTITLTCPYLGHARMDRVKDYDDVFTLKYFCEVINSLNFKQVYVLDPHSNVSTALLDRAHIMSPSVYIIKAIDKINDSDLVLCYPDEGAMKRYSDMIHKPYAFGIKHRDWSTGKIQSLELLGKELVKGKNILIVDDICSKGGTFLYTAKALKEAGAKDIYLYVTHCEKTILDGDMIYSGLIKQVYTTNSIYPEDIIDDERITILD